VLSDVCCYLGIACGWRIFPRNACFPGDRERDCVPPGSGGNIMEVGGDGEELST
jgi:hypothetical protein